VIDILIYKLATQCYFRFISIAAFFNKKAKLWTAGRVNLFEQIGKEIGKFPAEQKLIWFHCASVGEFEQGRPLMEAIRKKYPDYLILLSFFSPSGFELRKNYSGADIICYLAPDSQNNAKKWFDIVRPSAIFFIKYEHWYFFLKEAKIRNIPLYLIAAHFRPNQLFFKPWGGLHRKMLKFYSHIFVQNSSSEELLKSIDIKTFSISGDTRFDRVLDIKNKVEALPLIEKFCGESPLFVCGSSWPADEKIIFNFFKKYLHQKGWKLIIAPHEINRTAMVNLKNKFKELSSTLLYSEIENNSDILFKDSSVLIIDNIGMLSSIYRYAKAAYIGGGFGKGIHNTLEAAVFQIPVYFGPKHHKFQEAIELKELKIAFEINSAEDIIKYFESTDYLQVAAAAENYFNEKIGSCQKILNKIDIID
jgi:3-deoxy-D-manno-octulosonic-acid transferase